MAGSLDIYPFHDTEGAIRFGIQIAIFLVGVVVSKKLIITPAIKLHNERKKRTVGSNEASQLENERAKKLEIDYIAKLKKGVDEVRSLKAQEIIAAQKAANEFIAESQNRAELYLNDVKKQLSVEMKEAKSNIPSQIGQLVPIISSKIGLIVLLTFIVFQFQSTPAFATPNGDISFWYSIFWPYFQFIIFISALVYFARKPIINLLDKQRGDLRARLSEAKEAALIAERKIKEFESKISSLENEIAELKEQSLLEAKIEHEKIMLEARKVSESILKDAERAAKELIIQSKEEIRQEIFNLAISEVEKSLTPENLLKLDLKLKLETIEGIKTLN